MCVGGDSLLLSSFSSSLYASLFCTHGHCQRLVTSPSLMAFLCFSPTRSASIPPIPTPRLSHLCLASPSSPCPSPRFFLEPPPPLSAFCTVHFFLLALINTQCSLLSTPHFTHIWLADKLWMMASHITSKISIVFVNG